MTGATSLEWFYWLIAAWSVTLIVLPYNPAKVLLFAVFWVFLGWILINQPRYVPLMVILGLPAMVFAPPVRAAIPLVNNHTYFLVALVVAVILVRTRENDTVPNPIKWPPIYLSLVITASMLVSHLTATAQWHTWASGWYLIPFMSLAAMAKGVILFPFFAPIAFRLLSTPDHLRRTVHVSAIVTTLVSLEVLWELRQPILAGAVGAYNRAGGFIEEPNAFGGFLALTISLLIPLVLAARLQQRERLLFLTTIGVATVALLFTLSRGSWLALIVAVGYVAIARGLKAMVLVTVVVLTGTIWLPQSVIDRAKMTIQREDDSINRPFIEEEEIALDGSAGGRLQHWAALVDQWTDAPIFGHGFGSYGKLYGHIRKRSGVPVAAHSTIIEWTAEEGLLGFVAYFWLLWMVSVGARGLLRLGTGEDDGDFLNPLATGMIAATICLFVLDCSGTRMKNPLVMANMWILAGGLARQYWNRREVVEAAEREALRQKLRKRRRKTAAPATA